MFLTEIDTENITLRNYPLYSIVQVLVTTDIYKRLWGV